MRGRWRLPTALLAAVLLLAMAPDGAADDTSGTVEPRAVPLGADFRISGVLATALDSQPATAWNGEANEYLVVWQDQRYLSVRGVEIAAQRVSADGTPLGANFAIGGTAATASEYMPAVAWNQTRHQYLVVWSDSRNAGTRGMDIYGQRVSASGERLRGNFLISGDAATDEESQASVAWNGTANEYLVVWEDRRNQHASGSDIYGQRLSAAGERLGDDFRVSGALATSNELDAAVAWNSQANEYLVVWADQRNGPARRLDIYGQRVAGDGRQIGGNFRISGADALGNDTEPMLAYNAGTNQYLVVWEDGRRGFGSTEIYGRRVRADGKRPSPDFRVSGFRWSTGGLLPVVAWNAKFNEYLVVWADRRNESTSGYDIYARAVSKRGVPQGEDFRVGGPGALGHEGAPGIAYNTTLNQYLVVWQDLRDPSRNYDIWGRRVSG